MGRQTIPPPVTCTIEGCPRSHCARGLCNAHYTRARASGELRAIKDIPDDERFDARWRLDPETGCHIWLRGKDSSGYGQFPIIGQEKVRAHVYAWTRANGPVPAGLVLDHFICDNKACCNPEHLRAVPNAANTSRPRGSRTYRPAALQRPAPGHCLHGHEWTPENTYAFTDRRGRARRNCRACAHLRSAQAAVEAKAARHARGVRPRSRA